MQLRSVNNLQGIDISHWQGQIAWELVKKNKITFAYIKATEGTGYTDKLFSQNVLGAGAAGILTGAYHFCTPSNIEDAINEAGHFIKVIKNNGGFTRFHLPPVIDIENNGGLDKKSISAIVRAWVEKVGDAYGVQPVIYSYTYFIKTYLDDSLCDIPLWLAHYGKGQPPACSGWKSWMFLQYTDKGRVKGIQGYVDLNEWAR